MISLFKKIFSSDYVDLREIIRKGAMIIDVRSEKEFAQGHIKDSLNIPLEKIASKAEELKKHNHIVLCCRSGNRSGMAERTLRLKGLKHVTNGGSWTQVSNYIN